MVRNVWWPHKLSINQIIFFEDKHYKVMSRSETATDSFYFKSRYYTSLIETEGVS